MSHVCEQREKRERRDAHTHCERVYITYHPKLLEANLTFHCCVFFIQISHIHTHFTACCIYARIHIRQQLVNDMRKSLEPKIYIRTICWLMQCVESHKSLIH